MITSASFVIPMYNERDTIEATVKKLKGIGESLFTDYEIIIADDCSTDGSGAIIDRLVSEDSRVKAVHLERNTKFGGALSKGITLAEKEIIIYTDSDLPIGIDDIKGALAMVKDADVVTAYSRIKKGENLKRVIISGVYNFLIETLFRTNIKDINSGFKIYRKAVFENTSLMSNSPFIDAEIFIKALRKKCIIKQYPIMFRHREKGKSYISRPAVIIQTVIDMLKFKLQRL